jgi:diguanylate cyclase (GGDEF)-like protein
MMRFSPERRLREIERFQIVGTRREPEFDGLAELARTLTGLPMAAIGFATDNGIGLKAVSGLLSGSAAAEAPTSALRLMADAVAAPDLVEIEPADAPGIGHFVAQPLVVRPGLAIGVIALISDRPGRLTPEQRDGIGHLARALVDRLRLGRIRFERRRERAGKRARNAEIAAQRSEIVRQRMLLEQTSRMARIGGWEYDVSAGAMTWSPEVYRIVEMPATAKPSLDAVLRLFGDADRERVTELFRRALAAGEGFECEAAIRTGLGRRRLVRCLCEPQTARTGGVAVLVGTLQDISDRKAIEERIVYLARHDTLTGLANRAVFRERLEAWLQPTDNGKQRMIGLCMVDVDHFKAINDTLGHHAGDQILVEIGHRFAAALGDTCTVARIGGDEFAIILDRISGPEDAAAAGRALMRAAEEPVLYGDESIPVSLSVGMTVGSTGDAAEDLLKDVDIALYEAKGRGRNRSVLFDRSMREELELRQTILRDIRLAVERGELVPYYQPKVRLGDGGHAGFEALLRWRRRDGLVATPAFFGIAFDDPQLGRAIGETVIEQAAAQAGAWRRMNLAFDHVAVNVSTAQVRPGDLAEQVLAALDRHAVPAASFMVEVTETVLLSRDAGAVGAALRRLRAAGVRIALDDFGTGYASLTHLKDFPVDLLKIDRSFVASLGDTRESRAIVRGIAGIARDLGIAVIAEGIETEAQAEILARFGITLGQGFLYARPMEPGAATRHLVERAALGADRVFG